MFKMTFESGRGPIELAVTRDGIGTVSGEAYFRRDDVLAPVVDGNFTHPMWGTEYRVLLPAPYTKSREAVLSVLEWRTVGFATPFDATPGS